jgi:hypothetical protein
MGLSQVLRRNAMLGRSNEPPMDEKAMMDIAKMLLFRKGKHSSELHAVAFINITVA